ncbi:hypothetical protein SCUCBS95973_007753 [Sporothrix curviconia]|uniref:Uncharacterized protein n=1 Tax=Sporothrix curviconia TaxID=1260050 RepID=A0ABP0CIE6_9PEZI
MFDSLFKFKSSKSSKSSKKSSSKRYQEPTYPTNFESDFVMRAGQTYDASQRFQPDFVMRHGQTYDACQPIYANTSPFAAPAPHPEPTMHFPTIGNAFFTDMSSSGPSLSRSNAVRKRSTSSSYRENSGYPAASFIQPAPYHADSSSASPSSSSSSSRSRRHGHSSSSQSHESSSRRHRASSGRQPSSNPDCQIQRWHTCREQW